jgi:hypothetical protein
MKLQFSTSGLLLVVTFLAIMLGGISAGLDYINRLAGPGEVIAFVAAPIWMPIVFSGYVIGRRTISVKSVIAMVVIEVAILAYLNIFMAPY